MAQTDPRAGAVGIIGAGAAGLITGYTLLQDGFTNLQLITRDKTPGGVWAEERVYPGLLINNVHGEYRFSPLDMPPPADAAKTGGRLAGGDMRAYMQTFADKFLHGRIRYHTEVRDIARNATGDRWLVRVEDLGTHAQEVLEFSRIVLCTGGCSAPHIPDQLSPAAAKAADFTGLVIHSSQFNAKLDELLARVPPLSSSVPASADGDADNDGSGRIVIVGGGRSAQDMAAYLANQGRKVTIVFETADAVLAAPSPLPDAIRKSRLLSVLSPHIELRTRFERFLHTTWLGGKIVKWIWSYLGSSSLSALHVPASSPLRHTHSLFWGVRSNDEGVPRPNRFYALANTGTINLCAPTRVRGYAPHSVVLEDGRTIGAEAVVLATGYGSSWTGLFSEETAEELGIGRHPPLPSETQTKEENRDVRGEWAYTTLTNPPVAHPASEQWASSIYRGLIPAKNISKRDFAINGAIFTTNNGYAFEVFSHWISSYFLGDPLRLPATPEEALKHAERNACWLRRRYPDTLGTTNESYSSDIAFWTWPQVVDEMLEDMGLAGMRSGGNWLTWPFQVMDVREIEGLGEERRVRREAAAAVASATTTGPATGTVIGTKTAAV